MRKMIASQYLPKKMSQRKVKVKKGCKKQEKLPKLKLMRFITHKSPKKTNQITRYFIPNQKTPREIKVKLETFEDLNTPIKHPNSKEKLEGNFVDFNTPSGQQRLPV